MTKYISPEGIEYENYQAYCNSDDLDPDIVGVMLATNKRVPQNDYESSLLAEIKRLKKEGKGIEFPFN